MDLLEQFDDGGGRELDACQAVEPKSAQAKQSSTLTTP